MQVMVVVAKTHILTKVLNREVSKSFTPTWPRIPDLFILIFL